MAKPKAVPRISGVNIPDNKKIYTALTYIYGIGQSSAKKILSSAGVSSDVKASQLSSDQIKNIQAFMEKNHKVEGDLRREIMMNIKQLKDMGSWRGMRHIKGLPARGQRTKTNTRTVRGNVRKTVGSGRRPAASPT